MDSSVRNRMLRSDILFPYVSRRIRIALSGIILLYAVLYLGLVHVLRLPSLPLSILFAGCLGWIAGPVVGAAIPAGLFALDLLIGVFTPYAWRQASGTITELVSCLTAAGIGGTAGWVRGMLVSAQAAAAAREELMNELSRKLERQNDYLFMAEKSARFGTWEKAQPDGRMLLSPGMNGILGLPYSDRSIDAKQLLELTHPDDRVLLLRKLTEVEVNGYVEFEHRIVGKDGTIRMLLHKIREERDPDDEPTGISGTLQDITESRRVENEIRKLTVALQNSRDWIIITDIQGKVEFVNNTVTDISGFSQEEILQQGIGTWKSGIHSPDFYRTLHETLHRGESFRSLFICRKKNAELFYLDQTIIPVRDRSGQITNFVGAGKDVTQTKQMEERLNHLAFYDALTNLPNRHLFTERLRHALVHSQKNHSMVAVLSLDINRFRLINDSFGPKTGDEVLKTVAARLSICIHEGDTVARLGNDEWGVVLTDIMQAKSVVQTVETILREAGKPILIDNEEIVLSLCAGIAMFPDDGKNPMELIGNAEVALAKAKEEGKNQYQFFTADLNRKASEFVQMERDLFRAVENHEFIIHYQPYYRINDLSCGGMEALVRWKRKGGAIIQPNEFIPILEETGMIIDAGFEVIRMVSRQIGAWRKAGYRVAPIAVNLSALQFRQASLAESIDALIREYGIDPSDVVFEITESTFMQDLEHTRSTLWRLRDLGFKLSIDDFGTGYSSLSYLKRFPVNTLKIDKSFVSDLPERGDDLSIVRAIISMAKSLNLSTIAEGVQDTDALDILREEACDFVQGFYFSPPVPADVIERKIFSENDRAIPESSGVPVT